MKQVQHTLIATALCLLAFSAKAQVPNGDFERLNADTSVSNWGSIYIFDVVIGDSADSTDAIVFDKYFYFSTRDAHSGMRAIELRNAYNYYRKKGYAGRICSNSDTVFSGFASMRFISINQRPVDMSFYYKYFPVNGDTAYAAIAIYDSMENQIGEGSIKLPDATASYTKVTVPVAYTEQSPAAWFTLNFSTCLPTQNASFGTRLLIDDVSLGGVSGIKKIHNPEETSVYPNPASRLIRISSIYPVISVSIDDLSGRQMPLDYSNTGQIDCSLLPGGVYMLSIRTTAGISSKKLVVHN